MKYLRPLRFRDYLRLAEERLLEGKSLTEAEVLAAQAAFLRERRRESRVFNIIVALLVILLVIAAAWAVLETIQ